MVTNSHLVYSRGYHDGKTFKRLKYWVSANKFVCSDLFFILCSSQSWRHLLCRFFAAISCLHARPQWLHGISKGGTPDGDISGPCLCVAMATCSSSRVTAQEHNWDREHCHPITGSA